MNFQNMLFLVYVFHDTGFKGEIDDEETVLRFHLQLKLTYTSKINSLKKSMKIKGGTTEKNYLFQRWFNINIKCGPTKKVLLVLNSVYLFRYITFFISKHYFEQFSLKFYDSFKSLQSHLKVE